MSRRHFLDFAEMTPAEAASYGRVLQALYAALKQAVDAERVYASVTVEGVPHFHTWLFPRPRGEVARGVRYMAGEHACTEEAALAVVGQLRAALACPEP